MFEALSVYHLTLIKIRRVIKWWQKFLITSSDKQAIKVTLEKEVSSEYWLKYKEIWDI